MILSVTNATRLTGSGTPFSSSSSRTASSTSCKNSQPRTSSLLNERTKIRMRINYYLQLLCRCGAASPLDPKQSFKKCGLGLSKRKALIFFNKRGKDWSERVDRSLLQGVEALQSIPKTKRSGLEGEGEMKA